MKLGKRGAQIIKDYETCRLKAYMPTSNDKPTIGWGHTKDVKMGDVITEEQAEQFFIEDTADAVAAVNAITSPLTQAMFDALVSLVFNVGPTAIYEKNTVGRCLKARDYYDAWRGFSLWTKQTGKDLLGLARRRSEEMVLFLEDRLP